MSWPFRVFAFLVLAALLAGAVVVLRPQPVAVEVATVVRGPMDQKITDDGRARVRERYTVSAPVAGTLARIELHAGDVVEPGSVLARLLPLATPLLDPESRKAAELKLASANDASAQAQATADRAQIASDKVKRDFARVESLAKSGAMTGVELDQAMADARLREAELASAQFAAKVAQHEIGQARAALARFSPGAGKSEELVITSPVHGQVLHVLHESEGVVAAGAPLLEVADPQALELVADVLSQDAVAVRPGMAARVVHWGGAGELGAKVRRIEPAAFTKLSALGVDEQRVNVLLDLDGAKDGWRGLGDGFAVQIEITTWTMPDVIQIPSSALYRSGADWKVFALAEGRARSRTVEIGHRGPLTTEILHGLAEGESVIVHPGTSVTEGARVIAR